MDAHFGHGHNNDVHAIVRLSALGEFLSYPPKSLTVKTSRECACMMVVVGPCLMPPYNSMLTVLMLDYVWLCFLLAGAMKVPSGL